MQRKLSLSLIGVLIVSVVFVGCVLDLNPPEIEVEVRSTSTFLTGEVNVRIRVSENLLVRKVSLFVDDNLVFEESTSTNFFERTVTLKTSEFPDGKRRLRVSAVNNQGVSAERSLEFFFDNTPPSLEVLNAPSGRHVSGIITVSSQASDIVAVDRVELSSEASLLGVRSAPPFEFSVDTKKFQDGVRDFILTVYDKVGFSAQASFTVVVDNTPPAIAFVGDPVPDRIHGTITVTATASDNLSTPTVFLYLNETTVASLTQPPFSFTLKTTDFGNGAYTLRLEARDLAGNRQSIDKNVRIVNPGVRLWMLKVSNSSLSEFASLGQRIYVGSNAGLHAIDRSGRLIWTYTSRLVGGVGTAPLIESSDRVYIGTKRGEVICVNSAGTEVFYKSGIGDSIDAAPALSRTDTVLFVPTNEGKVYRINSTNGVIIDTYVTPDRYAIFSSPAVASDTTIYFLGRDNYFYALSYSVSSISLKWRVDVSNFVGQRSSSPAVDQNTGYLYIGSNNRKLYAFVDNVSTYRILWEFDTGAPVESSPVIGPDGIVYVLNSNGRLLGFRPNGEKILDVNLREGSKTSPTVADDGRIYVTTSQGNLFCVSPQGRIEWQYSAGAEITTSPHILDGGEILIGTISGEVHCVQSLSNGLFTQGWSKFRRNNTNDGSLR